MIRLKTIFIVTFIVTTSLAQNIRFERILNDQLGPSKLVSQIVQDTQGFIWFGTWNGLYRFDGYNLKEFLSNPDDPNSISGNVIDVLVEDSKGQLWIGTKTGGLNKFDPATESFIRYKFNPDNSNSLSSNSITSICEDYLLLSYRSPSEALQTGKTIYSNKKTDSG